MTFTSPLKQCSPTFHYRTSSFCCLPFFSSLELSKHPPKYKQNLNTFQETSSQIIFLFQWKFPFLKIASSHPSSPHIRTPNYHLKSTCSFNRPWCSSLNEVRACIELFINNLFLRWSPQFSTFELPKHNPIKKLHAVAIPPPSPTPLNTSPGDKRTQSSVTNFCFKLPSVRVNLTQVRFTDHHKQDFSLPAPTSSFLSHKIFIFTLDHPATANSTHIHTTPLKHILYF